MKRQYNEMQQRQLRPLPPALSPTSPVVATAAASVASAAAHSYPPPQFYFGWGPPHYPPPPHFYFGWGPPHYGQQQGWWPPLHPAPPTPPLMAYSSSASAINSTSYSIKAFAAATTSIAPPTQRQKNMDFRFSKMPKSRQVHTWKRSKYVLDAPKITGGKMAMHIPVEIVIEILVKLPTRALLRFKSVCKSWHSIIQDRYFISRHLQNNSRRSSCGLNFISMPRRPTEFYLCYFVKDVKDWHGFEIRGLEIQTEGEYYTISNSCDGLICVYTNSRTYVVNPSIRDVLELPKVPDQARTCFGPSAALVHDPTTGEYRVVRTFVSRMYARTSGCLIFTLGSCSWRFIDDAPLRISKRTIPAVVNETIYWDATFNDLSYYHNGPEIAVSLDMKSETFDTVMHPHSYSASISSKVYEVGGYLCLLDKMSRNMNQQTLWTLKDYNNNRWTKQIIDLEMMENVTVGLAVAFKPLGLRDGKILTSNRSNRLDFYDPVTGCFDKPSYVAYGNATAYIESLISPTEIQNKAMSPRFPESNNRVGSLLLQA